MAYVCDGEGRHPDVQKVKNGVHWQDCWSVTEANSFTGLCVNYRLWVEGFSLVDFFLWTPMTTST